MRKRPSIWNIIKVNFTGQRIQNLNTELVYIDKYTGKECIEINARKNRLFGELLLALIPIVLYLVFILTINYLNWNKIMDFSLYVYLILILIIDFLRLPFVKFKEIKSLDEAKGTCYRKYEHLLLLISGIGYLIVSMHIVSKIAIQSLIK